ncbi:MAG: helix-turn-helix transcriptional regulator [Eggerthellaceae bacterium]|nr:helix-turn-helix transcriptional regulator [Eggerthellaceae bacterium]
MAYDDASNLVKQIIGRNIRTMRKATGQSQTQFAKMIGVNRSYFSRIEGGKENQSIGILVKIADGLDVPFATLFDGLDACPPHELKPDISYAVVKVPRKKRKTR